MSRNLIYILPRDSFEHCFQSRPAWLAVLAVRAHCQTMRVLAFATVTPLCVSALLTLEKRSFQTSAVCLSDYSWVDNSKGVSPCYLAAVVLGSCQGNSESDPTYAASQDSPSGILDWLVPSISANTHYDSPNSTTANLCSW